MCVITCFLCKERPSVENSHVLPRLVVRAIANELGDGGFREISTPRQRVERTLVAPLLCTECEAQFQRYEDYFARSHLRPYLDNDEVEIRHDVRLLAFSISVLWRVLVYTLNMMEVPPGQRPYLELTEQVWRTFLRDDASDLGDSTCYLFLDREISSQQIKLSQNLNHVSLRFTIEQGLAGISNFIGVPYRQVVYAKLGPFIFMGIVRDFFHGRLDHLMSPWRQIFPYAEACSTVNDGFQCPDEIVATLDQLAAGMRFSEDSINPKAYRRLLDKFSIMDLSTPLKRLYEKDEILFREVDGIDNDE